MGRHPGRPGENLAGTSRFSNRSHWFQEQLARALAQQPGRAGSSLDPLHPSTGRDQGGIHNEANLGFRKSVPSMTTLTGNAVAHAFEAVCTIGAQSKTRLG
jgi:hypothetical protein